MAVAVITSKPDKVMPAHWKQKGSIVKFEIAWLSATGGAASIALKHISGELLAVDVNPGATTPSASWDFTIKNEDGIDIIGGKGTNMSNSTSARIYPYDATATAYLNVPVPLANVLTVAVTGAGDEKNGTITLYVRLC